jgi:hypothetical protein
MKYASAMKYGGELVAAVDCDYDSFKELVPLCPHCKEPVYLRSGGQRESVKGKAYQIGPHWCHFKGISAEQVSGCELRVNDYTEKDRAKIAAQARGQRLKLLQRWFWRALSDSVMPSIGDNGEFAIGDNGEFVLEPFSSIYRLQRDAMYSSEMEEWASRLTALLTDFQFDHEYVSSYISTVLEISNSKWEDIKLSEDVHPNYKGLIKATFAHLEVVVKSGIDIKVITEALNFLFSKKAVGILSEIVISWLCASCMIKGFQNFEDAIYCFVDPASVGALKIYILNMVINIPWASEFQRLEAEAQQRKDAA